MIRIPLLWCFTQTSLIHLLVSPPTNEKMFANHPWIQFLESIPFPHTGHLAWGLETWRGPFSLKLRSTIQVYIVE